MKTYMREMIVSLINDITAIMKDTINTTKGEQQVNLTSNSQPELITQDTPQQPPRFEEPNNLIDEIDIEKIPNKRKAPTPSEEIQNQENQVAKEETTSESASKTRAGARKSRQNKTLPKGQKQLCRVRIKNTPHKT